MKGRAAEVLLTKLPEVLRDSAPLCRKKQRAGAGIFFCLPRAPSNGKRRLQIQLSIRPIHLLRNL